MSVTVGRLALDDPEGFPEPVGESVANVGATPVPGGRAGLTTTVDLTSFPASTGDVAADRQRVRRQLRSLLNNLPYRLQGVYIAWSEDTDQSGWYALGKAGFDVADVTGLVSSFWRFTGIEARVVGRRRTHRRATCVSIRDLRDGTTPRDYLKRVYNTDFSDQTPVALTWLPSTVTDYRIDGKPTPTLTTARTGYGGSTLQALVGGTNLQVVTYEQDEANRNLGDVVIYDRRGTLTLTSTGPTTGWEEVYGPDWPLTASDAPVIENSLARVSYDTSNTDGFILERWGGTSWVHEGKIMVERVAAAAGAGAYCDTFVSADVMEWTPERGVIRAVMKVNADANSREEVYLTLQRGWTGPRVEVYPAPLSSGSVCGAGVAFTANPSPGGTSYARKEDDAGLQTRTGTPNFSNAVLGATSFNDENWYAFHPGGGTTQITMAVVQSDAQGWTYGSDSAAYGSGRNTFSVELGAGTTGYISAHFGMVTATGGTLNENSSTTRLGSQDLAAQVLYDSRSVPTIVSR
ncbi:MAG: hypothetical protein AB7O78_01650 [Thermoleophilia bacterium]